MSGPGTAGDVWISTLHTSGAASLDAAHTAFAAFVTDVFTGGLRAIWTPATNITDLETVSLDPVTGKQTAARKSGVNLIGTATGATISPRDCIVISKRTVIPTKAGRGRMYLPPPAAGQLSSSGLLLSSVANTLAAAFAGAMTTLKGSVQPVIYHHALKTTTPITEIRVGSVLGTQVRRTNRVFNAYSSSALA